MGNMDSAARPLGPVALGTVLGLLSVTELAIRLTSKSTVHAGLAAGPPAHAGVTLPTALLMCAFCLLATVPAGWLRPLPAALAVYAAALVSLVLFELVTIAGAAALLVTAYRLARSGSVVLAVALAAPFLGLALVLAGQDPPRAPRCGRPPHLDDRGAGGDRPADYAGATCAGRSAVRRDRRHRPGRADRDAPPARRAPGGRRA